MASFKKTCGLLVCLSSVLSMNAFANIDTSGVAQLEMNLPPAEGALTADQIPPLSAKAIIADEAIMAGQPVPAAAMTTTAAPAQPVVPKPLHLQPGPPPAQSEPPATGH